MAILWSGYLFSDNWIGSHQKMHIQVATAYLLQCLKDLGVGLVGYFCQGDVSRLCLLSRTSYQGYRKQRQYYTFHL